MIIKVVDLIYNKKRYDVIFSNDDKLNCTENLVLKYRLLKGKELEISDYEKLRKDALYYDYYDKVLNYLSKGLKSKKRIKQYLLDKGLEELYCDKIIEELSLKKLLDDEKVGFMIAQHYARNGYGLVYIKQKCFFEGITYELLEQYLPEIEELIDEYGYKFFVRHKKAFDKYDPNVRKNKIIKYLLNRGYSMTNINDFLKRDSNEK